MGNLLQRIILEYVDGNDEELLIADGYDDAVIGIEINTNRLIYSISRCVEILISQGMTREDAIEHFYFNTAGSFMGEKTPIWCDNDF